MEIVVVVFEKRMFCKLCNYVQFDRLLKNNLQSVSEILYDDDEVWYMYMWQKFNIYSYLSY